MAPGPAANPRNVKALEALKAWNIPEIGHGLANAGPSDLNIAEDFPLDKLTELICEFSHSKLGSNMITITCADPATYEQAAEFPERYDLLRVRMGGWPEFFIAMFDFHQQYIQRRPYYTPS